MPGSAGEKEVRQGFPSVSGEQEFMRYTEPLAEKHIAADRPGYAGFCKQDSGKLLVLKQPSLL